MDEIEQGGLKLTPQHRKLADIHAGIAEVCAHIRDINQRFKSCKASMKEEKDAATQAFDRLMMEYAKAKAATHVHRLHMGSGE